MINIFIKYPCIAIASFNRVYRNIHNIMFEAMLNMSYSYNFHCVGFHTFFKFQILIISWDLFKMSHLISIHSKIKKKSLFYLVPYTCIGSLADKLLASHPSGKTNLHLHVTPWKKASPTKKDIFNDKIYL